MINENLLKIIKSDITPILLILIGLISFFGSLVYYFYALDNIGVLLTLILTFFSLAIILKKANHNFDPAANNIKLSINAKDWAYLFIYLGLFFIALYILYSSRTADPIASPWQAVPAKFFIIYALATFILLISPANPLFWLKITLHYFLSFSVALIVYKIGYGFDPFIHQAALEVIDKNSYIMPKTFYYTGQYSLEIISHKIFRLPLLYIDKALVPVLASILLPLTVKFSRQKIFNKEHLKPTHLNHGTLYPHTKDLGAGASDNPCAKSAGHSRCGGKLLLLALVIPFSIFIVTVPQNLAYLFLILIILLSLAPINYLKAMAMVSLALAAFFIQPIAGIPAILFLIYYFTENAAIKSVYKKIFYILIFFSTSFILPFLFYLLEKRNANFNSNGNIFTWANFNNLKWPPAITPDSENFILNFVYLYGFNLKFIIILLASVGLFSLVIKKNPLIKKYLFFSATIFLAYILTASLNFNYLISSERSNYADRLLIIGAIFLLPFILESLYLLAYKIKTEASAVKIPLYIFICLLISASLYLSYPRQDKYYNGHGYQTSQSEITAVKYIDSVAKNEFIVLTNQQLSAAALRELGFKKYYKNNIFYYSIPTGDKLYSYYLMMVKNPSRQTMLSAMDFAGADEAYFVINKYWWASAKIVDEAKLSADSWFIINNGDVYIFQYVK